MDFAVVIVGADLAGLALVAVLKGKPGHVDCGVFPCCVVMNALGKTVALQGVTDGLQRLFDSIAPPLAALRTFGLNLTNHLPVVKGILVNYALAS